MDKMLDEVRFDKSELNAFRGPSRHNYQKQKKVQEQWGGEIEKACVLSLDSTNVLPAYSLKVSFHYVLLEDIHETSD